MANERSAKLQGNSNAAKGTGKHADTLIRLDVSSVDLICEALALEGTADPSRAQIKDAVQFAIRQVYGRKVEDQHAIMM